jgi:hypothetical protein
MNPAISALIDRLEARGDTDSLLAANILQAVFDPENQPSQYGTVLRGTAMTAPRPIMDHS